jgi:hypothetical protein
MAKQIVYHTAVEKRTAILGLFWVIAGLPARCASVTRRPTAAYWYPRPLRERAEQTVTVICSPTKFLQPPIGSPLIGGGPSHGRRRRARARPTDSPPQRIDASPPWDLSGTPQHIGRKAAARGPPAGASAFSKPRSRAADKGHGAFPSAHYRGFMKRHAPGARAPPFPPLPTPGRRSCTSHPRCSGLVYEITGLLSFRIFDLFDLLEM